MGWFEADLGAEVTLSTAPGNHTHWGQMVFPLAATRVQPGDVVTGELSLTLEPGSYKSCFCWSGHVERSGEVISRFQHDTSQRFAPHPAGEY